MFEKPYFNIDEDIESLLDDYIDDTKLKFNRLEQLYINESEYDLSEIKKNIHTIKGSSGTYGLNIISSILQHFEDNLKYIEDNNIILNSALIDFFLVYIEVCLNILNKVDLRDFNCDDIINDFSNKIYLLGEKKQIKNKTVETLKILFLDNGSKIYLRYIKKHFQNENFKYIELNNIKDFFEEVKTQKPNIIISNYVVDDFRGTGFFALLKMSSLFSDIKTILFTSQKNQSDIKGKEYCDYILNKNHEDLNKLPEIIKTNFNSSGMK